MCSRSRSSSRMVGGGIAARLADIDADAGCTAAESLVPSTSLPSTGSDSDWDSIAAMLSEDADVPAYVLVRLEAPSSDWLLACYVPDKAAVRQKMLYSSTKATLQRQLGDSKFKQTMFASTPVSRRLGAARAFDNQTSPTCLTAVRAPK